MSNRLTAKPAASSPSAGDVLYLDGPAGVRKLDAGYLASAASTAAHNSDPAAHLHITPRSITANLVLTAADFPDQRLTSDAARDVTLPAESTAAWQFFIVNSGSTYSLAIKRAGGTSVGSIVPGGLMLVEWDGTAFRAF